MAINFETTDPNGLLTLFKNAIKTGKVVTWSVDTEGDFTHVTRDEQWKNRAYLRPSTFNGWLVMNILVRAAEQQPLTVYSIYHGRFIESMLAHCRDKFTMAQATAKPTNADNMRFG